MHMLRSKYILFTIFLLSVASVSAQKAERDYIRKGNRLFNDSVFVDAEVNYRKALEVNPKSTVSMYNLGKYALTATKVSGCYGTICSCRQNRKRQNETGSYLS